MLFQTYQEQMISCSREILESIESIRQAATKEPENLGHMVSLYYLVIEHDQTIFYLLQPTFLAKTSNT